MWGPEVPHWTMSGRPHPQPGGEKPTILSPSESYFGLNPHSSWMQVTSTNMLRTFLNLRFKKILNFLWGYIIFLFWEKSFTFLSFELYYLLKKIFVWLCWVFQHAASLVAVCGSSSLTRDWTWAPCIGSVESDHWTQQCVLVTQLSLTLCNPMDYSQPGSSVLGILQAR